MLTDSADLLTLLTVCLFLYSWSTEHLRQRVPPRWQKSPMLDIQNVYTSRLVISVKELKSSSVKIMTYKVLRIQTEKHQKNDVSGQTV